MARLLSLLLLIGLMVGELQSRPKAPDREPQTLNEAADYFAERLRDKGIRVEVDKGIRDIVIVVHRPFGQ